MNQSRQSRFGSLRHVNTAPRVMLSNPVGARLTGTRTLAVVVAVANSLADSPHTQLVEAVVVGMRSSTMPSWVVQMY